MTWLRTLREWGLGVILAVVGLVRNIGDDTPGELTAEKDPQGRSVLRVLLAAVFGFDSVNDAWKASIVRREPLVVQTHNAASVAATTGTADSTVQTANGYDSVAVGMKSDASHALTSQVWWYADSAGTNLVGTETLVTATTAAGAGRTTIKAPYFKVRLGNTDAASHIMSSWTTLIP